MSHMKSLLLFLGFISFALTADVAYLSLQQQPRFANTALAEDDEDEDEDETEDEDEDENEAEDEEDDDAYERKQQVVKEEPAVTEVITTTVVNPAPQQSTTATQGSQTGTQSAQTTTVTTQEKDLAGFKKEDAEQANTIISDQSKTYDDFSQMTDEIRDRSGITRFFFGSDNDVISKAKESLVSSEQRIQELTDMADKINDMEARAMFRDRVSAMEQRNEAFRNLIDGYENSFSIFGWVKRLFS